MLQPDNMLYAGKSLTVHKRATRMRKFVLVETSYVTTPLFHKSCNSFTSG
ncbi:hypothetical protein Syun_031578 [Stephania yunnanensis]|uniref:Uncharacterized protein n=1 Tax=Stephania yunnanensis TaxID=152371 RepID=A0AAP0E0J2_9MAGN